MIFKDYYEILGLQSNKVSDTQIKNAYREYVKKYHPDLNAGNKQYEERFKDVSEAYNTLSNPISKRKYDRSWIRNKAKMGYSYEKDDEYPDTFMHEVSRVLFGKDIFKLKRANNKAVRGDDIYTEVSISIDEAFNGVHKRIALKDGNNQTKTYTVVIPSGIQNGGKIKLSHLGKEGKNGGKRGNLIFKVNIKDSTKFSLQGTKLKAFLDITPWEACLSSNVLFEGIDKNLNIYVPAGTQSGECIKVPNNGYIRKDGSRDELILETRIKVPKKMSEIEKELFTKLSKESNFNPRKKSRY